MAVDTAQKRASATHLIVWAYTPTIFPDGTISQTDRQAATFVYSGISASGASASSGMHRLANTAANEKRKPKTAYRSINWSSPVFGEKPTEEPVKEVPHKEQILHETKQTENSIYLSDVEREIQLLMQKIIAKEGEIAELKAITTSIHEANLLGEARIREADFLNRKKISLLLLLSAA